MPLHVVVSTPAVAAECNISYEINEKFLNFMHMKILGIGLAVFAGKQLETKT